MNLPKRSDPATAFSPLKRALRSNNATVPYNTHRPHRSLNQQAPADDGNASVIELGRVRRTTTCAGLINEYRSAA